MKLELQKLHNSPHLGMVNCVIWDPNNDNSLISIGADKNVIKWESDDLINLSQMDNSGSNAHSYKSILTLTDVPLCISRGNHNIIALGITNGNIIFISLKNGRMTVEKTIKNAHRSAICCLRWNSDGSVLMSAGEDGIIKQWSKSGNLRSKLIDIQQCIYCIDWTPNQHSIIYSYHKYIAMQPIEGHSKAVKWKGHNSTILSLDCNPINEMIISGSEDCRYRIWDQFGRLMYTSNTLNYPITCVKWHPNGDIFAVGLYNTLLLCDCVGWIYDRVITEASSILSIDWSENSGNIAMGDGNGNVFIANIIGKSKSYHNWEITMIGSNQLSVNNISDNCAEILTFDSGSVLDFSVNHCYLIVVTTKHCYIYQLSNLLSPQIINNRGTIHCILQTKSYFAMISSHLGIGVFSYNGDSVSKVRLSSIKWHLLNERNVSMALDCLAVVNCVDRKSIHLIDPQSSQQLSENISHSTDITQIALNECGISTSTTTTTTTTIAFIDSNKDLFIAQIDVDAYGSDGIRNTFKLATIVDYIKWHPNSDILIAISDQTIVLWYYPNIVWCDSDLLPYTRVSMSSIVSLPLLDSNSSIVSVCNDTLITVRLSNGAQHSFDISPLPIVLFECVRNGDWQKAIRLCHISRDKALWATLAGLALDNNQIDIALESLTSLEESDKILFLQHTRQLQSMAEQQSQLTLFKSKRNNSNHNTAIDNAEQILIANNLIYSAIQFNIRLYRWKRALDLAVKHKTHLDTVIWHRQKYLLETENNETIPQFSQMSIDIDWDTIKNKIDSENRKKYGKRNPKWNCETLKEYLGISADKRELDEKNWNTNDFMFDTDHSAEVKQLDSGLISD